MDDKFCQIAVAVVSAAPVERHSEMVATVAVLALASLVLVTLSIICIRKRRKANGGLFVLLGMFCLAIGGAIIAYLLMMGLFSYRRDAHLQYQQHLQSPDGMHIYCLFQDLGGGIDPSWHMFRLSSDVDPRKMNIPSDYRRETTENHRKWASRMLMWNWSEAGDHVEDPHIKIIQDRYLVFVRGGLYHGLYDIEKDTTIVDVHSPWHTYVNSAEYKAIQPEPSRKERRRLLSKWKQENLHQPIANIVEERMEGNDRGRSSLRYLVDKQNTLP